MKNTTTISIDLAKDIFQVAIFNKHGKLISNQAMQRQRMVKLIANHPEANIFSSFPNLFGNASLRNLFRVKGE